MALADGRHTRILRSANASRRNRRRLRTHRSILRLPCAPWEDPDGDSQGIAQSGGWPFGGAGSKFAIEAIGESLRAELHPWGISVSVVEPGAVKTSIWDKGRREADRLERALPEEARTRYARHVAAIRRGIEMQDRQGASPDTVAAAVEHALFSRRPKARYLVGTDARVQSLLVRFLPDRPREAIIRRFAGP